jgi:hypothetical protein
MKIQHLVKLLGFMEQTSTVDDNRITPEPLHTIWFVCLVLWVSQIAARYLRTSALPEPMQQSCCFFIVFQ